MKIVKVQVSDGLHAQFKMWAYSKGETMSGALEGMIGDAVGGVDLKVGRVVLSKGDMDEPLPKHVPSSIHGLSCVACHREISGEGYTYTKDKKPICQACARKAAGL